MLRCDGTSCRAVPCLAAVLCCAVPSEKDLDEVLQTVAIFNNVSKGVFAKEKVCYSARMGPRTATLRAFLCWCWCVCV